MSEPFKTFSFVCERTYTFPKGYGVVITPIWSGEDDEPDRVVEIDTAIVKIDESTIINLHGTPRVKVHDNFYNPVSNFITDDPSAFSYGDTHDLRDYMFHTRKEAKQHEKDVLNQWKHPEPWRNFIKLR